jgi:ubiquinone/menaquinone biosynthesis C-methylase UbiE
MSFAPRFKIEPPSPSACAADECAERYMRWTETPAGSFALRLQQRLLVDLLAPKWGDSVLDVGCGAGANLQLLADMGVHVTGLDRSPAMVAAARHKLGRVPVLLGDATELPFPDDSFDLAVVNTTLEWLAEPTTALREVVRVTRRRVYIGILNRWSAHAARHRVQAGVPLSAYSQAQFRPPHFVPRLLSKTGASRCTWGGVPYLPKALGSSEIARRTVSLFSGWPNPFAAYLGFAADIDRLVPLLQPLRPKLSVLTAPEAASIARVPVHDGRAACNGQR